MLQTIRNKATSLVSYAIIALICMSFALWGVSSYFEGGEQVYVASVEGNDISQEYYQNQVRARQQQYRQLFQNNLPNEYFESDQFKRQVLDQIINEAVINETINDRKYVLNDTQLADRIRDNTAFHTDGKFDGERYRRLLAQNNLSVKNYETNERRLGAFESIKNALEQSVYINDQEINDILKLRLQKRHVDYFVINNSDFKPEITDEEIAERYNNNQLLYQNEEKLIVEYVQLSAASLLDKKAITDEQVQAYYENNQDSFAKAESRHASHILIKSENDSEKANDEALNKAQSIIDKAKAGEDFVALAKEFSQDVGSASNGGDLGMISKGVMVKPFEDAVFAMQQEDEVSAAPIKTQFGYHIIKLTKLSKQESTPLSEVKTQIIDKLARDEASTLYLDQAEEFKNIAFESPESLAPLVEEFALQIKTSPWFTRDSGVGIVAQPAVRDAAFAQEVIIDGLNSEVVETEDETLTVMRKKQYQNAQVKPLDEVKEQITTVLKQQKSADMTREKGMTILNKLKEASQSWDKVLESEGVVAKQLPLTRKLATQEPDKSISESAFKLAKPTDDKANVNGIELIDGYAVYQLNKVEEVDEKELQEVAEAERNAIKAMLNKRYGNDLVSSIIKTIKLQSDIKIIEKNL